MGRGDQAFDYYKAYLPAAYNDRAEVRQIEPYVYCQSTDSKYSPHVGASRLPWLSGAATWAYSVAGSKPYGGGPRRTGAIISQARTRLACTRPARFTWVGFLKKSGRCRCGKSLRSRYS